MRLTQTLRQALAAAVLCCVAPQIAYAQSDPEMVVKAVMIRKFAEFIRWPDAVAPQNTMQVNVCVYGDAPMSEMTAVFSKTSASNPVKFSLSTLSQLSDAGACHILFVGASRQSQVGSITAALAGKPVLTVSDADGFAEKGGMIGFRIVDGKVRYDINNRAFGAAQLKVDAQLLEIANKVVE